MLLPPVTRAHGTVVLPGSKSISNRTLLLAAMCDGDTIVRNLLQSDDTEVMLTALRQLGVRIEAIGGRDVRVSGCGGRFPQVNEALFLGNAGTAFRPLTAMLALQAGNYRLSGVARMHERPIGDLVDALRQLGAQIRYAGTDGFPPLEIEPLQAAATARVLVRGDVSSQFLSALLMAAPMLGRPLTVEVTGTLISRPYVEITLNLMSRFGVTVQHNDWREFRVVPSVYRSPGDIVVEGDASSASYFLAAGAIGRGPVRVQGVGRTSIQGDVHFAEALSAMGAEVSMGEDWMEASGSGRLKAIDADFNHIPDAAMTLGVAALFADGVSTLRNIASWRVKETDRIAAMATELQKFGAIVEEGADYIRITPPHPSLLTPHTAIDTYDDHRMAMCFSLLSLAGMPVTINDPGCVAKTYPNYFDEFRKIVS